MSIVEFFHQHLAFVWYLLAINVFTFSVFAYDKAAAAGHRQRIRESVLLELCWIGGWIGGLAGMIACHHKTRKTLFKAGVAAAAAVWIIGIGLVSSVLV